MPTSTGRLSLAPDDQSRKGTVRSRHKTIGTAPQTSGCVNNRYGAGPTHNPQLKVPTMDKSTRGFPGSDSETRATAVKITPAMQRTGPVTPTHTSA
jgi:hypothetical protein